MIITFEPREYWALNRSFNVPWTFNRVQDPCKRPHDLYPTDPDVTGSDP